MSLKANYNTLHQLKSNKTFWNRPFLRSLLKALIKHMLHILLRTTQNNSTECEQFR